MQLVPVIKNVNDVKFNRTTKNFEAYGKRIPASTSSCSGNRFCQVKTVDGKYFELDENGNKWNNGNDSYYFERFMENHHLKLETGYELPEGYTRDSAGRIRFNGKYAKLPA